MHPLHEFGALHEIRAVEAERPVPVFVPPVRDNIRGVLLFLVLLFFWHGVRWRWFGLAAPSPPFPESAGAWAADFGLDVYRFRALHEFWRAITALTMHADSSHLLSNLGFGLLFFLPLCSRAGLGLGMALAVLAGVCGNAVNALVREPRILSIGFSTALFGGIGALCVLNGADIFRHQRRFAYPVGLPAGERQDALRSGGFVASSDFAFALAKRLLPPLAAGMALLGFLGGVSEARADYPAHIGGFCCGIVLALLALPLEQRLFARKPFQQFLWQTGLFILTLALLCMAWGYALFR